MTPKQLRKKTAELRIRRAVRHMPRSERDLMTRNLSEHGPPAHARKSSNNQSAKQKRQIKKLNNLLNINKRRTNVDRHKR